MNVLTYGEWRDTCDTVHMLLQMMGKAKLQSMDPQPEWKQVVLDADANGFTTGLIPFGADGFEINLNIADAEMAGILQRYYADFSFMFLAAAVLLCFVVNESLAERAAIHDLMLKLLLVLVGVSVAYSALLCLAPETGWYSDVYPWAYQGLLDAVVFWR